MKTQASKTLKVTLATTAAVARRKVALALCVALCMVGLAFPQDDDKATIITFDAPGAGTGSGLGTFPLSINSTGAITGYYTDANFLDHGFLRARDGTITTIDAPDSISTDALSINLAGVIAGSYIDANFAPHGFVRAPDGTFTTFDAPDAGFFIEPITINPEGAITGRYVDASAVFHGFLRAPTALSLRLTLRRRALVFAKAPSAAASTRRGRSRDVTLTQIL